MDLQEPTSEDVDDRRHAAGDVVRARPAGRRSARSSRPRSPTPDARSATTAEKPGVSNLIEILSVATGETFAQIEARYDGKGYGDLKGDVAEAVVELLRPAAGALRGAARRRGRAGADPRRRRGEGRGDRPRRRSSRCTSAWASSPDVAPAVLARARSRTGELPQRRHLGAGQLPPLAGREAPRDPALRSADGGAARRASRRPRTCASPGGCAPRGGRARSAAGRVVRTCAGAVSPSSSSTPSASRRSASASGSASSSAS